MTPDRIRVFMYKPPSGGRTCTLSADLGLGSSHVVATWTREECERSADPSLGADDVVQAFQDAAQDYVDNTGEPTRFTATWLNAVDKAVKSAVHTAEPQRDGSLVKPGSVVAGAEPMSANRIVSELLAALLQKDKVMQGSFGIVLQSFERALTMQQKVIDSLAKLSESLPAAAQVTRSDAEIAAELQTHELKQAALGKLIDLGPDVAKLGLKLIEEHMSGGGSTGKH